MKRRWRVIATIAGLVAAFVLVPVAGIEIGCAPSGDAIAPARSALPPAWRRPEARTWLTYPEWHIVYSAESLGRHLAAGRPPSGYPYGADVAGFWRSFCAINRTAGALPGAGEAKLMVHVIGLSFTAEMAIKAGLENTIGRLTEWIGGWATPEDRHAARVQQAYGAFLNEVPWYRFDFGAALSGLWRTHGDWSVVRRPERRVALSAEYAVKLGYAKALGAATGASLAPDARTLRMVLRAPPNTIRGVDPRLRPVGTAPGGTVVEAPRYAQFTDLAQRIAAAGIPFEEIAGNRRIFVTLRMRDAAVPAGAMLAMPLGDRPGWQRVGVTLPAARLSAQLAVWRRGGAEIEHVYDY